VSEEGTERPRGRTFTLAQSTPVTTKVFGVSSGPIPTLERAAGVTTYLDDEYDLWSLVNDPSGLGHFFPKPCVLAGNVGPWSSEARPRRAYQSSRKGDGLPARTDRFVAASSSRHRARTRRASFLPFPSSHTFLLSSMNDCTLHRNHLPQNRRQDAGGGCDANGNGNDELDLEKAQCRRQRGATSTTASPASLELDAATVHKKKTCSHKYGTDLEDGSAGEEDPTCEMSLSTMETDCYGGLEGQQLQQQQQQQHRFGGGRLHRGEEDGSSSFTELAFASMDMDRHGPLRGGGGGYGGNSHTEHHRHRRYARQGSSNDNNDDYDFHPNDSSFCDGMGESMFGESFALDDGSSSYDVEAHHNQSQRSALLYQASRSSQQLACPVVDEE
jgi:hypothetical protein